MATPKIYVPRSSARQHTFPDGKSILKLSFKAKELVDFIHQNTNPKGYINLTVSERREMGQYGDTHSVSLDTWQPKTGAGHQATPPTQSAPPQEHDDVPF